MPYTLLASSCCLAYTFSLPKGLNVLRLVRLLIASSVLLVLGGCAGNVSTGYGGALELKPSEYAVLVTHGWINEWVWVRTVNGELASVPGAGLIGVNMHRLRPGEHEVTYQFYRDESDEHLPIETAKVTLKGGGTYRIRPLFQNGDAWVGYSTDNLPARVTAQNVKFELVTVDPAALRSICERTAPGISCGRSLLTRP